MNTRGVATLDDKRRASGPAVFGERRRGLCAGIGTGIRWYTRPTPLASDRIWLEPAGLEALSPCARDSPASGPFPNPIEYLESNLRTRDGFARIHLLSFILSFQKELLLEQCCLYLEKKETKHMRCRLYMTYTLPWLLAFLLGKNCLSFFLSSFLSFILSFSCRLFHSRRITVYIHYLTYHITSFVHSFRCHSTPIFAHQPGSSISGLFSLSRCSALVARRWSPSVSIHTEAAIATAPTSWMGEKKQRERIY